jgi:hypothetical protein
MLSGEEKMWRAVIAVAVSDALSNRISDWIFGGDDYFKFVCDLANISPEKVRKEYLKEKIRRQKITN